MTKVICFVDDDSDELERFESAMKPHNFTCVTGSTYKQCVDKLEARNPIPDLWVLDLFFPTPGTTTSPEKRSEMADKYAELEQRIREFRAYLTSIGQGPQGGMDLLKRCREAKPRVPIFMFTRKGTLEDAIRCYDAGVAAVLKKPMPNDLTGTAARKKALLDKAFADDAEYLAEKFYDAIRSNNLWNKHRGKINFVLGAIFTAIIEMTIMHMPLPFLIGHFTG